jgi:hypothetical protein
MQILDRFEYKHGNVLLGESTSGHAAA